MFALFIFFIRWFGRGPMFVSILTVLKIVIPLSLKIYLTQKISLTQKITIAVLLMELM